MKQASEVYQKTADNLRRAVTETLGPREPASQLLTLAADQLENAADTARLLEHTLIAIGQTTVEIMPVKPSNSGQWEGERDADLRKARLQGILMGAAAMAAVITIAAVLL